MNDDKELNQAKKLCEILENAIKKGPWDKSLFLQTIGKKLQALKDKIQLTVDAANKKAATLHAYNTEGAGDLTVFISLYLNEGANLARWERLLNTIGNNIVTRPVYRNEDDLLYALRAKENQTNDAYISALIKQTDLIKPLDSKPLVDRYGHELILVRQGAILPRNIFAFVHKGQRYHFRNGCLIKQQAVS